MGYIMGNDSSKLPIIEKSQCNKYIQNKPCSSNIQKKLLKIYFRKWNFEQLYLKFICKNRYNLFYGYFNYWLKEANIFSELSKYFNIWYTNIFSNKYNKYKIKKVFKYWKYLSKEKNLLYNYSKFYYTFN